VLRGHSGAVTAVDFAPDGRTLASAGAHGTVRLWSVPARREVAVMPGAVAPLTRVRFTPDGRHLLAFAAADLMRVWSTPIP
jgi:WD40 repeat protein